MQNRKHAEVYQGSFSSAERKGRITGTKSQERVSQNRTTPWTILKTGSLGQRNVGEKLMLSTKDHQVLEHRLLLGEWDLRVTTSRPVWCYFEALRGNENIACTTKKEGMGVVKENPPRIDDSQEGLLVEKKSIPSP